MTRLRYIGLKSGGERAFEAKTGIVWMPGSEHEVSTEHAAQMLPHDDVWEIAEPAAQTKGLTLADAPVADPVADPVDEPPAEKRKPGRPRKDAG